MITYDSCKKLIYEISHGLKYLAKKNIAHRDIKPDNIVIEKGTNRPVIVDFGLATVCDAG